MLPPLLRLLVPLQLPLHAPYAQLAILLVSVSEPLRYYYQYHYNAVHCDDASSLTAVVTVMLLLLLLQYTLRCHPLLNFPAWLRDKNNTDQKRSYSCYTLCPTLKPPRSAGNLSVRQPHRFLSLLFHHILTPPPRCHSHTKSHFD